MRDAAFDKFSEADAAAAGMPLVPICWILPIMPPISVLST
jgi:hypothetical protein